MKNYQTLIQYGITDFFINQASKQDLIGRITSLHKKHYKIITNTKEVTGIIKGSFLHHKNIFLNNLPCVGDFVVLNDKIINDSSIDTQNNNTNDAKFFINRVLKRKNYLSRKLKHGIDQEQIIASNLDYIFIVDSILTYNIAKISRMYFSCLQQKITPILIFNKIDQKENIKEDKNILQDTFKEASILFTSKHNKSSIDSLFDLLKNNKTGVFIGSSGVGKSSLINLLLDNNQQKIQEVNKYNSKGQHTTTSRDMFLLKTGGLIIDTPGIKEFGIWLTQDNIYENNQLIEQIKYYSLKCKFRNCKHIAEPGCQVLEAINNNLLSQDSLNLYNKIKDEVIDNKSTTDYIKKKEKKKFLSIELKKITRFKKANT